MNWLLVRALLAVLALPGTIGFAIPLLLIEPHWRDRPFAAAALVPIAAGVSLLALCVREFYASGKGTLAPWSPPIHLVTSGPYRFSRNPMYVAVSTLLLGWAWAFHSWPLLWWALFMMGAFQLRILLYEEPRLTELFGDAFRDYRARVPRWVGRVR